MRFCLLAAVVSIGLAAAAEPGRWDFTPNPDEFRGDALLDLRSLNEPITGFVRASPEGDFLDGAGKPLRFWAVNTGVQDPLPQYSLFPPRDLDRHARWLAKRGVNMVRWHGVQYPLAGKNGPSDDPTAVNRQALDGVWRLVAAMKKEGVYTTISPYWANALKVPAAWGLGGPDKEDAHGLLFFHPKMQIAYRAWLKTLFTEPNPYTGVPLAQEPAVAIIQLQNEDSLLFWTFNAISKESKALLGQQFHAWATKKYGPAGIAAEWQGAKALGDGDGTLGFFNHYDLTSRGPKATGGKAKRLADQVEFLTETMRTFNAATVNYLRSDLGCKQLVNCGNWRTADAATLGDAERYSYTAGDVIGVNRYFGAPHRGAREGWAVMRGDKYADVSVLDEPWQLPVALRQVRGIPTIVSECSWTTPNARQAESAFLAAAYQSLTGVDAVYWFATGATEWQQPMAANGFARDTVGKWVIATPEQIGQFPAAALAFRKGLIRRGTPAVVERRSPIDLWQRKRSGLVEEAGYDPNTATAADASVRDGQTASDPLAFLVGPVEVAFGNAPAGPPPDGFNRFIDRAAKVVRSNTGEIALDWGRRVCTLDAPAAQGVCGYLKSAGGTFKTADVTIASGNDYGAVLAVSMDGKPLATSGRVLVQVGTVSRPTGWRTTPTRLEIKGSPPVVGAEVVDIGRAPWSVVNADVRLTVRNAVLTKATALDANGNAAREVAVERADGGLRVTLPPDALYVVLQ